MNYKYVIFIFIFMFWTPEVHAVLDCSKCHIDTDIGKSIVAKDTIEISNRTCLKCHNGEYPPTSIGYNTHLAHVGKYSVKVDYLARHPNVTESLSCGNCHLNIGNNCRNCHIINIPHVKGEYSCKGCHGEIDKLFRHATINLKIHDIFNLSNNTACTMCHSPGNMMSLRLASGDEVPIQEPHRLCYQCHSAYYRLWDSGSHYSNKTMPKDPTFKIEDIRKSWEDNWRRENTCTNCHNPHNPNELYQLVLGLKGLERLEGMSNILSKLYIYIAGIIIMTILLIVILKYKISSKLLSTLKTKISIPISISIEREEKIEKDREEKNRKK